MIPISKDNLHTHLCQPLFFPPVAFCNVATSNYNLTLHLSHFLCAFQVFRLLVIATLQCLHFCPRSLSSDDLFTPFSS
jgi:hypothetical protein